MSAKTYLTYVMSRKIDQDPSQTFLSGNSNFNTNFEFSRKSLNFASKICMSEYSNATKVDPVYVIGG
jgi:hypothetical protein